ncbi:hypothetical protein A2803_03955 [Candidatus Woesebacteria bacterium RIFCSPHIGHO2_01_FULL_44_21]|uniref:MobA-like NTP transferase domain-containing protein n=1 Tax=Candidatus Woesebacteria bacterium RIFCSPHIGHO2_01_FULL_44_21 TaxID=1802503 RepID=A0A1F7YWM1_9BACT|nr:MAG: hypothetical protein A2803_03955 [Candidatus Woesebacteria bacterium RIFCSPHIGHO2_01_FULL_44_21]
MADIIFVNQNDFAGISKALLKSKRYLNNSPFLVALPDLPTISETPVIRQMLDVYSSLKDKAHVVSFDKFKESESRFYGECLIKLEKNNLLKIAHFCPTNQHSKKPHHKNNHTRMSGRFIFTPEIFPVIRNLLAHKTEGVEINDRSALGEAQKLGQSVIGYKIKGKTYDTGYPKGFRLAYNAFYDEFENKSR